MKKAVTVETPTREPRASGLGRKTGPGATQAVKSGAARKAEPAGLLEERFLHSEAQAVTIEYFNPTAREVLVAGSFNDWQPQATPLVKQRGGKWSTQCLLKPGQYQYRFVVDGQWQDDPMAARFVANPFGGLNSVLEVQ